MTPPRVAVEQLSLSVGEFHLERLDFSLAGGEILVILGPNGSGKSVTLESIAGFHSPDSGRVLIGGRDVTRLPPERRNVAFLVQDFGLFPHLTVEQNVAIALRRGRERIEPDGDALPFGNVAGLLAHFDVGRLAGRTPQALSPGEKQRVALARALAARPDLFLFDEPFSALDAHTRDQLREDLLSFLRRLSLPAIFVTHDHVDALTFADKIIVLRDGVTMQAGDPRRIFHEPANAFVARFVGVENILTVRVVDRRETTTTVAIGDRSLEAAGNAPAAAGEIHASIRAEDVVLYPSGAAPAPASAVNRLQARVVSVRTLGPLATVVLECGFGLRACIPSRDARALALEPRSPVDVEIAASSVHLMMD